MSADGDRQTLERLRAALSPYGQQDVLRFWNELSHDQRAHLAGQIGAIDLAQVAALFEASRRPAAQGAESPAERARRAEPPPAIRLNDAAAQRGAAEARRHGEELLAAEKVGVVLVAGGQGTRLGFDHPKGLYPIGPLSGDCLFKILFEKLLAMRRRYAATIPLYLMTSPATHDETVQALRDHDHFGLPAADVFVFCQGTMAAVDAASARLLLAEKDSLSLSPDGHGGMLAALAHSGGLDDIRRRGIGQLFYLQVDNPLVVICDPVFLGHHALAGSEVSTQVVAKRQPLDRVGNVVQVDGQVQIIEYSDLPDDVAQQRQPDGSLKLWAGNIAVHALAVEFLARMTEGDRRLPFHFAHKKVPYVDEAGRRVDPPEPNAIKFEQFIFDLLPAARRALVVEVDEAAVFAPLKNAPGSGRDSPESVRAQMIALHRQWLATAGAVVAEEVTVEISPLVALEAADMAARIAPGTRVDRDTLWQ